jgi:Domain of unknown function (DUF4184)
MAFTISHAVVALPFFPRGNHKVGEASRAATIGIAIGSMLPDVEKVVPSFSVLTTGDRYFHTFRGLLQAVLPLALLTAVLVDFARPEVIRFFTRNQPSEKQPTFPHSLRALSMFAAGTLVGGLSHIFWDAFTHHNGWITERVAWFRVRDSNVPRYWGLWVVTSALGLAAFLPRLLRSRNSIRTTLKSVRVSRLALVAVALPGAFASSFLFPIDGRQATVLLAKQGFLRTAALAITGVLSISVVGKVKSFVRLAFRRRA